MSGTRSGKDRCIFEEPKGSGRWLVRVYHQGHRYKRVARSKSEARDILHRLKAAILEGRTPAERPTPAPVFDELLADYRETKRREGREIVRGEVGYRRLLERFGGRRGGSIEARDIEHWRDMLLETLAPATVNRHLTLLRAILGRAVRHGRIEKSPVGAVAFPKESNGRVRYLSDDEEARLMVVLPEWLRPLVLAAIHTGMRKGELLGLKWDDVDLYAGAITLRETKSGEIERVPVNQTVRHTLAAVRDERMRRAKATGDARALFGRYVFCARGGGRLMNLNRYWYPALREAEVENLHFHDLRHTFCSRLAMKGIDLYRVQKLARHRSPRMTMRYAHLSPGALREAVEALDGTEPARAVGQSVGQLVLDSAHRQ